MAIPRATYRLQLQRDFPFARAVACVPYLARLGISHAYCSPYLKARPGSPHGYDIVDHNALNPEIGSRADLEAFAAALRRHGMGQILDMVPNHMGVGGADNAWWLDVLEHGEASAYADYFDIDWRPVREELRGKVLLPVLGDHYGAVLERGELVLGFDAAQGAFHVHYHEHRFPLDPASYPRVLAGPPVVSSTELDDLLNACAALPPRTEREPEARVLRRREAAACQQRLAGLCARAPSLRAHIEAAVAGFNGTPGAPASFDALHALLERQAYRLAYWQVAADEINYRRFFDINDLAGLRMERPEVFHATHGLVLALASRGFLQGLRIDHPDGLYDPAAYLRRLQEALAGAVPAATPPFYVVVEKILAPYEHLPESWPVAGTTGYDFASSLDHLLLHPDGERSLERIYARFLGQRLDFDETLYERKRLVIGGQLSGELTVLANLLNGIAQADRHTRDYTLNGLRGALAEVVACFPVYRTYVTAEGATEEDRRYVDWAVAQAVKRSTTADPGIFAFLRACMLLEEAPRLPPAVRAERVRFALRLQQYTAPVMAKALEDTTFYIYHRLVSLNEVGGAPQRFALSVAGFHIACQERRCHWPHALLATSTHDTKRSEDVRARLHVLSELTGEWRTHLGRWARLNRGRKRQVDERPAPSRNDEYLLYQTLLGIWPLEMPAGEVPAQLRERIAAYMRKAVREAKVHSSWMHPHPEYEEAVAGFVERLLARPGNNAFLADFVPFARRVARLGLYNSLAQVLLKLAAPGVPDLYQGCELWAFQLVDPDNRRPVDYARRDALLAQLEASLGPEARAGQGPAVRALLDTLDDGRAKLLLTWRALGLRARHAQLFRDGDYRPLEARGAHAGHLCAFARHAGAVTVITVVTRFPARLCGSDESVPPLGAATWDDTCIELPEDLPGQYRSALTGEPCVAERRDGLPVLPLAVLLAHFPVALLVGEA
jgi:(1->4)-alpha-D-glucan 1-alpha-D-glucosylmutase